MKYVVYNICIIIALLAKVTEAGATHNRAGEITYKQIGPLTIEMTIITYTKNSSSAADRDSLDVVWGDGTKQFVRRDPTKTRIEPNDIKVNFYIGQHTYPGASTFTVSFQDPNRIGNILNVNYPNSIDIPFFLSTTFTLLDPQFQGFNNSAILLQPPIDVGCVNKPFLHNPNAYDIDGDSLAFSLGVPLQAINTPVPLYKLPDEIGGSSNNDISIDPVSGQLVWNSPKLQGEYNIVILIKEYRNGKLINVILRDMQVLIRLCENDPPIIKADEEICIIAGQKLVIDIDVDDPNLGQKVKLTATGGPFTLTEKAVIVGPVFFTKVPYKARLEWQTTCDHISKEYFKIVLRAADNFFADSTGLATLRTIRIKVVGPPPEETKAVTEGESIKISWKNPYTCQDAKDKYFQGFSVWRKIASSNFALDTCDPGLTGSPYTKIAFKVTKIEDNKYTYIDTKIEQGVTYCYRVQAEFARLTSSGNPYNRVEGLASDEICIVAMRDLPMITKVSVQKTDKTQGIIHLRWTKPLSNQLDTVINKGPYSYEIFRSDAGIFSKIETLDSPFLGSTIDTNYFDPGINTLEKQYTYEILFKTAIGLYGKAPSASSVFLEITPTDQKNILNWQSSTPWNNTNHVIYKQNSNGSFDKLSTTSNTTFEDTGLNNNVTYCYYIEAEGSYGIENIEDPLINLSQITCQKPKDDVPPCAPDIKVINICDQITGEVGSENLFNTVEWDDISIKCPEIADDIAGYNIYYAPTITDSLAKIKFVSIDESRKYFHFPELGLLGCYSLTSIDLLGNESISSKKICVDNCPYYTLPNTFTPNGDGYNDVFEPTTNLFVSSVDFKVFNAWGNLVFQTSDPKILWDGTKSGTLLPDGTYHYVCRVFENRVSGIKEADKLLSGFIHILKN